MKKNLFLAYCFYAFFLIFLHIQLQAQDPYHIVIDKTKGLPSNGIYDIFQDKTGFIWFAHKIGITRYDGYEFITYQSNTDRIKTGSDIHQDKYGRIWYQNFDGYIFYLENNLLQNINQNQPRGYYNFAIIDDKIMVLQQKGIDVFDLKTLKIITTIPLDLLEIDKTKQSDTHFYCATKYNIYIIDYQLNIVKINTPISLSTMIGGLQKSKNGMIIFPKYALKSAAYEIIDNQCTEKINLKNIELVQNGAYAGDYYWLATTQGAYGFDENGNSINDNQAFFADKSVSYIMKDREGNFWFSTTNEGVFFVPKLSAKIFASQTKPYRLFVDENMLYVGTKNGAIISTNLLNFSTKKIFQEPSKHEITVLKYDKDDVFLSASNRLGIFDLKGQLQKNWAIAIKDLQKIDEKYYAYGASGKCGLINIKNKTIVSEWDSIFNVNLYKNVGLKSPGFEYCSLLENVRGKNIMYVKDKKQIYFSTNLGLFQVTPKKITEIKYLSKTISTEKVYFYGNDIYYIDAKREIYKIDKNNKIERTNFGISVRNFKILDNYLFLITTSELFFIDLKDKNQTVIPIKIYDNEVNDLVFWKDKLLIAFDSGIILNDFEKTIQENNPVFVINNLKINGIVNEKINEQINNNDLELAHNQNNIEINYAILSFKTNFNFPLYYKINDNNWELMSAESRILKLLELSPNDYTISFRLGNDISSKITTIQFTILKPWWKNNLLVTLYIIILALILYFYYKFQTNILKNQNKLLLEKNQLLSEKLTLENSLNKSVLTSIKAQMNPHFFYNALNTIQSFIFTDNKREASNYLAKFSKLTRMILEMSEKDKVALSEEIKSLSLYLELEKMCFDDGDFDFQIIIDENINLEYTKIPSMIIQPYIENAIKHGLLHTKNKKNLHIILAQKITNNNINLIITIDDNGIGRKRSTEINETKREKHQSFATKANQKRLEILNQNTQNKVLVDFIDNFDDQNQAIGTKVIITIPI